MNILISGASGLVGTALNSQLIQKGYKVHKLVRKKEQTDKEHFYWNPENADIDLSAFDNVKAVINLSGENISALWTKSKKKQILNSREQGTQLLVKSIIDNKFAVDTFLSASAIGYYGSSYDITMTEDSPLGTGFLAEVCKRWEDGLKPLEANHIRTVKARIGMVLSRKGGALPRLALPFRFGVGGRVGNGNQYWSWVDIDDLVNIFIFALENKTLQGVINAVSPNPVLNREFSRVLSKVVGLPAILPVPSLILKTFLGEMAESIILNGARVIPEKLSQANFTFAYENLENSLRKNLNKR